MVDRSRGDGIETELISYGPDILVVDDTHTNLIAIEAALAPTGRKLVLARSGVEALAKLLKQDFSLIILDVAMPTMDGFETAQLVRSRERNRATPIIFITGMTWHEEEILKGYALGAVDFLIKPVHPDVLRAKATVFIQLQERTLELRDKAAQLRRSQALAHEHELQLQRERFEAEVLEHKMAQMAAEDRRKDEFLAILAHELRNPLQPLQTAVELLEGGGPVSDGMVSIIRRQIDHMSRLVDDLLDVARFQTGKLELRRELVAIESVIDDAVVATRAAAEARHHTVNLVGERTGHLVLGDPVRLVQVISNLLSNAIKFTDPGGVIEVRWGFVDGRVSVRVTDNGKGIEPSLLPRIFDMFVQERTTPDGSCGLGLGLGLAKRLVELHGGQLRASSDGPGTGASFELQLSLADRRPTPEHGMPPLTREPITRLRTIVIEDDADLRELVADLLRAEGHEVKTFEDGRLAIETIREQKPDVVLVDIGLRHIDGYEVARTLRAELPPDQLRLIALTGYGAAHDRASALKAGFDAHIVKPASAEKIMRAVYGKPATP